MLIPMPAFDVICRLINLLILSLLVIAIAIVKGNEFNLVDYPGGRKQHSRPVPVVGGVAIYIAFALSFILDTHLIHPYGVLLVGMGVLALIGAIDDAIDLPAGKKVVVQFVVVLTTVVAENEAHRHIGFDEAWQANLLSTCFLMVVLNAVNLVDGVDGLAGGILAVTLGSFALWGVWASAEDACSVALRLLVPVLAFLTFNLRTPWRKIASVFLGDAGTLMLGCACGWLAIDLSYRGVPPLASILVLALPLADMVFVALRRCFSGCNPFRGDRQHLHHILLDMGIAPTQVSLLLTTVTIVMSIVGLLEVNRGLGTLSLVATWVVFLVGHVCLREFLRHRQRVVSSVVPVSAIGD